MDPNGRFSDIIRIYRDNRKLDKSLMAHLGSYRETDLLERIMKAAYVITIIN